MTTTETRKLETMTCTRCGGSGEYSYCQMYGSTCFKCSGRKVTYTKRGAAARAYLDKLRSKTAAEIAIGDEIYYSSPHSVMGKSGWGRVTAIVPGNAEDHGGHVVNGEVVPPFFVIESTMCGYHVTNLNQSFRVRQTPEQARETLTAALDYQDRLTKEGKPRKR